MSDYRSDPDAGCPNLRLRRVVSAYKAAALFGFNVGLVFVVANVIAAAALALDRYLDGRAPDPVTNQYGVESLVDLYPSTSPADVHDMLGEVWSIHLIYEPFTQIREPLISGRWVTVDAAGFRHSADQGSWPPDSNAFNVFLFGGSTAFSYGLSDAETVASQLQRRLRSKAGPTDVRVYNFGRGWYFSTQERILFEQLLMQGHRPDLAIFLDGLNDFSHWDGRPYLTDFLERSVRNRSIASPPSLITRLPVHALAIKVLNKLRPAPADQVERVAAGEPSVEEKVDTAVRQMEQNARIIGAVAREYGVRLHMVVQPVPTYGYDLSYHRFAEGLLSNGQMLSRHGYARLARVAADGWDGPRFTWCADIQRGLERPLYVDAVHYSAEMAGMVADCIADAVSVDDLNPRVAASD